MAQNNNRNVNQNGGNFGSGANTCNNCGKTGHPARDCRSNRNSNNNHKNNQNQNRNQSLSQNYNQNYSQNVSHNAGKWCSHCNKDNHNIDICKFKNQDPNGKQKRNKQNANKWCSHCSKNNHNTEDCSLKSHVSFNQNLPCQNGQNLHFQSGQFQTGQFQNPPPRNTQYHNINNQNIRPCKHCSGSHYDSSCRTLISTQNQEEQNPVDGVWNGNVPGVVTFQPPPVTQANPYVSMTCVHCAQPGHPSSRCPHNLYQQQLDFAQTQQHLSFQGQFPHTFAPIHHVTPVFMQTVYRNPLINAADLNDGCSIRSHAGRTLPSGYSVMIDDRFHPTVSALVDRDGDVVMGDTTFLTAIMIEGFESYGEDSMAVEYL